MSRLAIILLLFVSISSCKKSDINPYQNDLPLIGSWISKDGRIVMNIKDVENKGDELEKYYEYTENGQRMLRRTYQGITSNYQVVYYDGYELRLADRLGTIIPFLKAS